MSESEVKSICQEITFSSDDLSLKGTLHLPQNVLDPPVIVGSHGLFSDSNSAKQIALAEACTAHGMAYFRFDHRGCGQSAGDFRGVTTFEGRCHDLLDAVSIIRQRTDVGKRIGVFGSSLGGAVCLATAKQGGFSAIITFAAFLNSVPLIKHFENTDETADQDARMKDVEPERLRFDIPEKHPAFRNILIFHGDSDKIISPSEAHRIYARSQMLKRLILLRDGDHRMSLKENQEKFIREAVAWYKLVLREPAYPATGKN